MHAVQRVVVSRAASDGNLLALLLFKNAFNCVDRLRIFICASGGQGALPGAADLFLGLLWWGRPHVRGPIRRPSVLWGPSRRPLASCPTCSGRPSVSIFSQGPILEPFKTKTKTNELKN